MSPKAPVYLVLIHHPVRNKQGDVITTAITNLDIHDGSRLSATYGLHRYFLVSPLDEQQSLVTRVCSHWLDGPGARKNPTRRKAMEKAVPVPSIASAIEMIKEFNDGVMPMLVGTSAQPQSHQAVEYEELREQIMTTDRPVVLLFGTGWGIAEPLDPPVDRYLPPIVGFSDYNHLSVRAAMAITLDRLLYKRYERKPHPAQV